MVFSGVSPAAKFRFEKRRQQTIDLQEPGPSQLDVALMFDHHAIVAQLGEAVREFTKDVGLELALRNKPAEAGRS